MTSEVGRRAFLASATTAGVGATVLAFNQPVGAHDHPPSAGDPRIEPIAREIARIVKEMPATPGPGPLLAMASALRMFAAAVDAGGHDREIRAIVQRLIVTEGSAAIIARATSPEIATHRRQLLVEAGIPVHQNAIADRVYETQLQALAAGNALVTQTHRAAAALEKAYATLQTRTAGVLRVRQDPAPEEPEAQDLPPTENPMLTQIFRCAYLGEQCDYYSAQAALVCSIAANLGALGLALAPICAGLGLAAGGYCYAEYHYDCY
jgi:hypothetical protein